MDKVRAGRLSQQRCSGSSRLGLLPAKAPSCSNDVCRQIGWRRRLPPLGSWCRTACNCASWQMATLRWWDVQFPPLPTWPKGGPALVWHQSARPQRRRRHRPLPQRALPMPHARERLARLPSDSLTSIMRFEFRTSRRPAHIG